MKRIDFYFDFLSPFSYFAWLNLPKLKAEVESQGVELQINYFPVIMAKLFDHHGIKGPGEVPPKRDFLFRQMMRYAKINNIPFTTPKTHPFNPLYALRLAVRENGGDDQEKIIDVIWKAGWNPQDGVFTGVDLGDPDKLVEVLNNAGLDGEDLMERTYTREVKQALKYNISKAIELDIFGVPGFIVEGELFWGNDSLPTIKNCLLGEDNLDFDSYSQLRDRIVP